MSRRIKAHAAEPFESKEQINMLREYLRKNEKYGDMYALLITCGCNLGLRAGDLRQLKVEDFKGKYLYIQEEKTGKRRRIFINKNVKKEVEMYLSKWMFVSDKMILFARQGYASGLGVKHIHKVIKRSCRALGFKGNYGSHSMRKTFAQSIYKEIPSIRFVRNVFRHNNNGVTASYINETEAEKSAENEVYEGLECFDCKKSNCIKCKFIDSFVKNINI